MLARIHAVKLPVVHRDVVHVAGSRLEFHHLDHLTGLYVVFDEAWSVTLIAGGACLLMPVHLPDKAIVVCDAVQALGETGRMRRRKDVIYFPSLGVDSNQGVHAIRGD